MYHKKVIYGDTMCVQKQWAFLKVEILNGFKWSISRRVKCCSERAPAPFPLLHDVLINKVGGLIRSSGNNQRCTFHLMQMSREKWLADKKEKEEQQKMKEDEEKKRLAEEEGERKAKAEEAYNRWYQDASKKPKPVPSSFGVSKGMLKGRNSIEI